MRISKIFCFLPLLCMILAFDAEAAKARKPQRFKSYAAMKHMLAHRQKNVHFIAEDALPNPVFLGLAADGAASSPVAHSETNVQVAGVDEGDNVKTDGHFIYQIADGGVRIVRAYPALEKVTELTYDDNFYPIELYVEGSRLVVLGNTWQYAENPGDAGPAIAAQIVSPWFFYDISQATAKVYNIEDPANPLLEREASLEGDLLSSRKIGNNLYFISQNYPRFYYFADELNRKERDTALDSRDNLIPHFWDSAVNDGKELRVPLSDLYYFPGFVDPNYVIVASLKLDQPNAEITPIGLFGTGDMIYASLTNLFLSAADYTTKTDPLGNETGSTVTNIYKFALADGSAKFLNYGQVRGTVLNQFSMDQQGDYFRIATTTNKWASNGSDWQNNSWSNVYVLDNEMKQVGALKHLAQGEQIFAARFIGDRCYLVTFEQTDPLFVIDLATPSAPKVLGSLEIPGFSTYLHPYDDTHLLGFGQDADEQGRTQGLKIALFDVGDVEHPKQLHNIVIGGQGSYSPLLYDHKALWFDKDQQLWGFPVQISEHSAAAQPDDFWSTTQIFEGAYVYKLTLQDGFQYAAKITHKEDPTQWDYYSDIQRLLTVDDQLFTISLSKIQSQNLADFNSTGAVTWDEPQYSGPYYIDQPLILPSEPVTLAPAGLTQ